MNYQRKTCQISLPRTPRVADLSDLFLLSKISQVADLKLHPCKDGTICVATRYIFFRLRTYNFFCRTFVGGTWIDSLEAVECEKTGPEVRYRIYLDDLDRF